MGFLRNLFVKKQPKNELSQRLRQSGNVFLMLFGAVGMVGVLGASTMTVMKGPVKTMSEVTKRTVAENNMIAAGKLALIGAVNQANSDCDGDNFIEPIEPAGAVAGFTGGGSLPPSIGVAKQDPWGGEYVYCAWDHGSSIDDSTCGGGSQGRLQGADTQTEFVLAIISAGPDGMFDTTCNDYVDANADDVADIPLVNKTSGADDLVLGYTYGEAGTMSGGLWNLSDPDTAEISKNISIKDSSNTEQFAFDATGGNLQIGGAGKFPTLNTDNLQAFAGAGGTINVDSALSSNSNISTSADMSANDIAASGDVTVTGAMSAATLAASGNATVGGTLGVTGDTTLAGLTAGTTTLGGTTVNSLGVTAAASIGGTLGVSGLSTLDSLAVTNDSNLTGALNVTGATGLSTLGTSGLATLSALSVTNDAAVGGNTTMTGTLGVTGLSTLDSLAVTNNASIGGELDLTTGKIVNLGNPTNAADATNKAYVDALVGATTGSNETDPQVDNLTANKWCIANSLGTKIDCTADSPSTSDSDTLGALSCTSGQIAKFDGTNWACAADDGTGGGSGSGGKKICSGSTTPGIGWIRYGGVDATISIDTSHCGFTSTPTYVTSISNPSGAGGHWSANGESAVYLPTATSFSVYIQNNDPTSTSDMLALANDNNWVINWVAMEEGVGTGGSGSSGSDVSYTQVRMSGTAVTPTIGATLPFNTVHASKGSDITHSGNQITLKGGKSYRLQATIRAVTTGGTLDYHIYDVTNGTIASISATAGSESDVSPTVALVSPTVDTTYEVRFGNVAGAPTISSTVAAYSSFDAFTLGGSGGSSSGGGSGGVTTEIDVGWKYWTWNAIDLGHAWYSAGTNFRNCEPVEYFQTTDTVQNTPVYAALIDTMGTDRTLWDDHPEHAKFLRDFTPNPAYAVNTVYYGSWAKPKYGASILQRCQVDDGTGITTTIIGGGSGTGGGASGSGSGNEISFRVGHNTSSVETITELGSFEPNVVVFDNGSGWDSTNHYYVAPEDGTYMFSWMFYAYSTSNANRLVLWVDKGSGFVNNSLVGAHDLSADNAPGANTGTALVQLNAGDKVRLGPQGAGYDFRYYADLAHSQFSGFKVGGGAGGSSSGGGTSSELIGFTAQGDGTQTVATSTYTDVIFATEEADVGDNYNPSTGVFTAPEDGMYQFNATSSYTSGISGYTQTFIRNNTASNTICITQESTTGIIGSDSCSGVANLSAGDEIIVRTYQTSGVTKTLGGETRFSGFKVGSGGSSSGGGSGSGEALAFRVSGGVLSTATAAGTALTGFSTEYDPGNVWNTNRFQPTEAGDYFVTLGGSGYQCGDGARTYLQINKNGAHLESIFARPRLSSGSADTSMAVSAVVSMNGTTDYVDFNAYTSVGSCTDIRSINANGFKIGGGGSGSGGSGSGSSTPEVAFSVHKGGVDQTSVASNSTVVTWPSEFFDTNDDFDTATGRFTPTVEGHYQINAQTRCGIATTLCLTNLNKNGSVFVRGGIVTGNSSTHFGAPISTVVYMNGTTDYLEVTNMNAGTNTVVGSYIDSYFSGFLIGGSAGGSGSSGSSTGKFIDGTDTNDAVYMNGNVGIGTADPNNMLNISGSSPVIRLTDTDTNADSVISADGTVGGIALVADLNNESANSAILFNIDGVAGTNEKMRITSSGNVGIGTNTPSTDLKLDVEGKIGATEYCDQNGANCTTLAALGGSPDNLGAGGTTAGTLFSQNASGYGYLGSSINNSFRFDDAAVGDELFLRLGGNWEYYFGATNFRPYTNNTKDLGLSAQRWKDGWFAGTVTAGSFSGSGSGLTAIPGTAINANSITAGQIAANAVGASEIANGSIVATTELSATGTKNASTFLRGDNTWATIPSGADNLGAGGTTTGQIIMNNASPTLYLQDTDHRSGMIHQNSNLMYFLTGSANNSTAWAVNGSTWPMTINMINDNITIGGNMNFAEGNLDVGSGSISGGLITGQRLYNSSGTHLPFTNNWNYLSGNGVIFRNASNAEVARITGSTGSFQTNGTVTASAFLYSSDARLKENAEPLKDTRWKLKQIPTYRYNYKADAEKTKKIGVMAQDVIKVYPEAVSTDEDGMMAVDYPALVPALIQAVNELSAEVEALKAAQQEKE